MYKQIIPTQKPAKAPTINYEVRINKCPLNQIPSNIRICAHCSKAGEGYLKCPKCKYTHYCSDKCYKANHKVHKTACCLIDKKGGIAYDKNFCLNAAIKIKLGDSNFKQSGLYKSGKKYWRMFVDDWNDNCLRLVSIESEELNEHFAEHDSDIKCDKIFMYVCPDLPSGLKFNWISKDKY